MRHGARLDERIRPRRIAGTKPGRERADERILIHTTGLVTQDVAICHYLYEQAKAKGMGITLPAARPPA